MNPPIVLLTDFGVKDGFSGVIKGVVATIAPDTPVIDLSHGIESQNILHSAYLLAANYTYFPKQSVFCCIVDPGVGSNRRAIAIRTQDYIFLAPDNGLLTLILEQEKILGMRELTNKKLHLPQRSATFHGRDIFAPAAAHITRDILFSELGKKISNPVKLDLPHPVLTETTLTGSIIYSDNFGNLFSNINYDTFQNFVQQKAFTISCSTYQESQICASYSEGKDTTPSYIFNSWGLLEIFMKNARADSLVNETKQIKVVIMPPL